MLKCNKPNIENKNDKDIRNYVLDMEETGP